MAVAEERIRTSEPPRLRVRTRIADLWRRREVLVNLARKETKVKYKSSALGVAWSMMNPLLYLVVFFVVFTFILPSRVPDFAVYLLSGLLAWALFSTGLSGATSSVVNNASLVGKVAFPREILPLSALGSSLVNFGFQFLVLLAVMLATGYGFLGSQIVLLPLALAVLLLFTLAVGLLTSALNVRYRDTAHLVELLLLAWFWFTPVIYPARLVLDKSTELGSPLLFQLYQLNPMVHVVLGFQRALYGARTFPDGTTPVLPDAGLAWYAIRLGVLGAISLALLLLTWRLFFRRSGDFAEELG
ncbi:MAG TPA: ABC transporter permease [Actinomycetota bacterium]|nr:ABC transporter permease [Actinomycetota bacterium]